jgi:hypothetical protein
MLLQKRLHLEVSSWKILMLSLKPARLLISIIITVPFTCQIGKAQSSDAKPKPTASISGHVVVDGKAASGIPVAAVAGTSVNQRDAAAQAVTDNEGFFVLSGLTAGPYQVWTLTPGMIAEPASSPNYFPYYGSAKSILLGANEQVANVEALKKDLAFKPCEQLADYQLLYSPPTSSQ